MIKLTEEAESNILNVKASGKLTTENYEEFTPAVERMIQQHGKIRVLIDLEDFHGWTAGALWQDTKFAVKHFSDIERLAFVGETTWEQGMATFCKPFTTAEIRYFAHEQADEARKWITA